MGADQPRIHLQSDPSEDTNSRFFPSAKRDAIDRLCLVVDDDTKIICRIAEMLAKLGYRVDKAENGSKALEKISRRHYDIVLCDLEMPFINGFLLSSRIKIYSANTKTVIMVGRHHANVLGPITTTIVDAWLFKPVNLGELCRVLNDFGEKTSK